MKKIQLLTFALLSCINIFAQAPTTISEKPALVLVKGGRFTMGGNQERDEKPFHSVTLSSFRIGKYEVTVGQYKAFCTATGKLMPEPPSWGWQDNHPMVNVDYNDVVSYCSWLGKKYGGNWRLPTEAEWEYAARGGNKSVNYIYSGSNDLDEVGWYEDNAGDSTQAVGCKKPNQLGIYDMSGNVWEWCNDWYGDYEATDQINPHGVTSGTERVSRGASWHSSSLYGRLAYRGHDNPSHSHDFIGFRVVFSRK